MDCKWSSRKAVAYVKIVPKIDMKYSYFSTSEPRNEKKIGCWKKCYNVSNILINIKNILPNKYWGKVRGIPFKEAFVYCLQNKNKHFHSQKGADLEMIVILNPISRFNLHLPHSLSFFFSPELSLSYYFAAECIICFIYFIYKKMWKCCYTFLMSSHEIFSRALCFQNFTREKGNPLFRDPSLQKEVSHIS